LQLQEVERVAGREVPEACSERVSGGVQVEGERLETGDRQAFC